MPKAREVAEYDIRFDYTYPAFTSEITSSNKNIAVTVTEKTAFGTKFTLTNLTDENQLVSGDAGDSSQSLLISGRVMHDANEVKVERTIDAGFDAAESVEFSSDWLQDRWSAELLAEWTLRRMSDSKQEINLTIVGNPLIEVADVITVRHGELSISPETRYVVYGVNQSWDSGLTTSIKAYEI